MVIHPIPAALGLCAVLPDFLSPAECRAFIARAEGQGFHGAGSDYPPSYRNNERLVMDDAELADQMTQRLLARLPLPALARTDAEGVRWQADRVNERFRFCRYRENQAFHIHQDGVHHRGPDHRSQLTFMVYLTDGDEFEGGDTLFFDGGPDTTPRGEPHPPVRSSVRPQAGSLIVFDHRIWHAGAIVTRGVKHIMRSDLMFRAERVAVAADAPFSPPHQGYVWAMCALPGGQVASAGRDASIRIWDAQGRSVATLQGHEQSVLAMAMVDNQRLASVSRDRSLRIWDLSTRRCERRFTPHGAAILSVAVWQGLLITGGADGDLRITDLRRGECTTLDRAGCWQWALDVTADGLLASAGEDRIVRVHDLPNLQAREQLPIGAACRSVAFSRDGRQLAVGDIQGRITVWSRQSGRWQQAASWQAHQAAVRRVRHGDDGTFFSGGEDGWARCWSARQEATWQARHGNFVTDVLPASDSVLTCAYDGRIARHMPIA
ncbi:2OG-Fe(II) oxygenase [Piscinibacter terrae]|uniref:2OG-Fe(II) oxygenase n=1 Tax=Piscinibacter terrae TaxID=2496871 RepID=A0A3N7HYB6_9BURK|nr:2OG-Fe(II) oxygenase [Albitalea terrae]RQP26081.1 2OG-Fe(II) oxygenase [Albitalea terrae]